MSASTSILGQSFYLWISVTRYYPQSPEWIGDFVLMSPESFEILALKALEFTPRNDYFRTVAKARRIYDHLSQEEKIKTILRHVKKHRSNIVGGFKIKSPREDQIIFIEKLDGDIIRKIKQDYESVHFFVEGSKRVVDHGLIHIIPEALQFHEVTEPCESEQSFHDQVDPRFVAESCAFRCFNNQNLPIFQKEFEKHKLPERGIKRVRS